MTSGCANTDDCTMLPPPPQPVSSAAAIIATYQARCFMKPTPNPSRSYIAAFRSGNTELADWGRFSLRVPSTRFIAGCCRFFTLNPVLRATGLIRPVPLLRPARRLILTTCHHA